MCAKQTEVQKDSTLRQDERNTQVKVLATAHMPIIVQQCARAALRISRCHALWWPYVALCLCVRVPPSVRLSFVSATCGSVCAYVRVPLSVCLLFPLHYNQVAFNWLLLLLKLTLP